MTSQSLKLLFIAGARPNFMKVAPLIKAAARHNQASPPGAVRLDWRLVHTGQHYDEKMSDVFFRELGIPAPDVNLGAGSGSHASQTATIISRFEPICFEHKPDWVVVVGDVNSTMACTIVCAKLGVKVAHVEAGLRSFDRTMPEEINRIVTDALADLLLTPSEDANKNLRCEGVSMNRIKLVGNVMIDALVANVEKARASQILDKLGLRNSECIYVTLHRPSNVDEEQALSSIIAELQRLAGDLPVVFPIHPRTRKMCHEFGIELNGVRGFKVIEPIGYHDSLCLAEKARLVLTDSGGLQEESTYFRTPCLTLRPNTERPVTVQVGSNRLTSLASLRHDLEQTLAGEPRIGEIPPLWDGHAAERIIQVLAGTERIHPEQSTPVTAAVMA